MPLTVFLTLRLALVRETLAIATRQDKAKPAYRSYWERRAAKTAEALRWLDGQQPADALPYVHEEMLTEDHWGVR